MHKEDLRGKPQRNAKFDASNRSNGTKETGRFSGSSKIEKTQHTGGE